MSKKSKRKHTSISSRAPGPPDGMAPEIMPAPASAPCLTEAEAQALDAETCVAEAEALIAAPAAAPAEDPAVAETSPAGESLPALMVQAGEPQPERACVAMDGSVAPDEPAAAEAAPAGDRLPAVFGGPPADWLLPDEAGQGRGVPSAAEAEQEVLLRMIPDQVFRIRVRPDIGVSVTDGRGHEGPGGQPAAESAPASEEQIIDPRHGLRSELARRGPEIMDAFRRSGEVQTLEMEISHDGQVRHYEIRAAGCAAREVLAVVHNGQTTFREIGASSGAAGELLVLARDVTSRREAEASIARSHDEVARLNQVLQSEASVHAEDEELMENAFRKLGGLLEDTIGALQMIVQMKDPPTARHQARVCKLACAIGRDMGLEKSQVDTIGLAALLHDLGKVLIPGDMLNKPGKLTEKELSAIRDSAETEYQILKTIDLFCPIADIVHQHHERLDGSGYPLGLKGDDILLEARIIAVADVVEAMVSERPYRPALSLGEALKEIQANKGKLYDAQAVHACSRVFTGGSFALDGFEDNPAQEVAYSEA